MQLLWGSMMIEASSLLLRCLSLGLRQNVNVNSVCVDFTADCQGNGNAVRLSLNRYLLTG